MKSILVTDKNEPGFVFKAISDTEESSIPQFNKQEVGRVLRTLGYNYTYLEDNHSFLLSYKDKHKIISPNSMGLYEIGFIEWQEYQGNEAILV